MTDHSYAGARWCVVSRGDSASFVALDAGQTLSTTATVEPFDTEAAAVARMRDFDPVFRVGPIDLNAATSADLEGLPGVGPALAAAIVASRPYQAPADLAAIEGITAGMVAGWGEAVFVGDPPPAPAPPPFSRAQQLAHLADLRWQLEVGGLTLPGGMMVQTDRSTQSQITSAVTALDRGLISEPVSWKMRSGFVDLTAAQVNAVGAAVSRHVQACFSAERTVAVALAARDDYWTIEVGPALDAAYAAAMGG